MPCHPFPLFGHADKQVFKVLDVVGWYATGPALTEQHMHVHRKVTRGWAKSRPTGAGGGRRPRQLGRRGGGRGTSSEGCGWPWVLVHPAPTTPAPTTPALALALAPAPTPALAPAPTQGPSQLPDTCGRPCVRACLRAAAHNLGLDSCTRSRCPR